MSRSVILGTAGHIDHGKTALVKALTGVDTDRLAEEQARGITIDLGFAELSREGGPSLGVVDVPGHQAFVRTMVAGATGMDVVLLVVAADEGVMPQTREHLAVVELLGVERLVVALTKCDLVEPDWLELVDTEVAELLARTPWAAAPRVPTSVVSGAGLTELVEVLHASAAASRRRSDDLARLPVDRAFTIQGTGTVVTGTLWSGTLVRGDRVLLLPGDVEARIRTLQVHGREVQRADAGERTAVALAGVDKDASGRGTTLVCEAAWRESWMLTVRVRVLDGSGWAISDRQRVRVHLGTREVMARCALLDGGELAPGESGWVQLRLEEPLVGRAGDRIVLRSYSPMTTIGGGEVAEPLPPKRKALDPPTRRALDTVLEGGATEVVRAAIELAGWAGVEEAALPIRSGQPPSVVAEACADATEPSTSIVAGRVFSGAVVSGAMERIGAALDRELERDPLRPAVPLERLRAAVPAWAHPAVAEAALDRLAALGRVEPVEGGVRRPGHRPEPTPDQRGALERIADVYAAAGLAFPAVTDLPRELAGRTDLWSLLKHLEGGGRLRSVAEGAYVDAQSLAAAEEEVMRSMAGREGLRPADFRDALPVTRKHLIPLLNHLDGRGVTVRRGDVRDVPARI